MAVSDPAPSDTPPALVESYVVGAWPLFDPFGGSTCNAWRLRLACQHEVVFLEGWTHGRPPRRVPCVACTEAPPPPPKPPPHHTPRYLRRRALTQYTFTRIQVRRLREALAAAERRLVTDAHTLAQLNTELPSVSDRKRGKRARPAR